MYNVDIIPWFPFRTNETSHQLRQRDGVFALSGMFELVIKKGQFLLGTSSTFLRRLTWRSFFSHQLVRWCNVSKPSVSLRYQLWCPYDVLS